MAYTVPTSDDLILRYPAFAAVDEDVIDYWITDAQRIVTTSWTEEDYSPAILSLAAYNLALNGYGTAGGAVGDLAAMGVKSFKSASMEVSFDDSVAAKAKGGYSSNRYGVEFQAMLRRNRGGARLIGYSYPDYTDAG